MKPPELSENSKNIDESEEDHMKNNLNSNNKPIEENNQFNLEQRTSMRLIKYLGTFFPGGEEGENSEKNNEKS